MAVWDSWERDIGGYTVNPLDILGSVSGAEDIIGGAQTGDYGRMALGAVGFIPGIGQAGRAVSLLAKGARGLKATQPLAAAVRGGTAAAVKPGIKQKIRTINTKLDAPMLPGRIVPKLQTTRSGRLVTRLSKPSTLGGIYVAGSLGQGARQYTGASAEAARRAGVQPDVWQQQIPAAARSVAAAPDVWQRTSAGAGTVGSAGVAGGTAAGGAGAGTTGTGPTGGQGGTGTAAPTKIYGGMSPESEAPPVDVQRAEADYAAALARSAAGGQANEAALRDLFSQKAIAAQGSAADVYGGRSRAIMGQALTGARRGYVSGTVQEQSRALQERADIKSAYEEAVRRAYAAAAEQQRQRAAQRAAMATQITGIGV